MSNFTEQREAVIAYIRGAMKSQGATLADAVSATTAVYFFASRDVMNLYRCINSRKVGGLTRAAIIAHDFNGLAAHDPEFLPKSRQFEEA